MRIRNNLVHVLEHIFIIINQVPQKDVIVASKFHSRLLVTSRHGNPSSATAVFEGEPEY